MRKVLPFLLVLGFSGVACTATESASESSFVYITMETTDGVFILELDAKNAPVTTGNFVQYVEQGHYDGTLFHRVIPGFMAQGGGYDVDFNEKETREPIVNESGNGLSNLRGTIAMAREPEPNTATAQYYINLVDNLRLNPREDRAGYTVFGKIVDGMHIIDGIAAVPTGPGGEFEEDVPFRPIVVYKAFVSKKPEKVASNPEGADK